MKIAVTRGEAVESTHVVDAVVADLDGPVAVWGRPDRLVIARSALKFVQVLPLLRTGAAHRFGVTDIELALACSSHSGEPAHVDAVRAWLHRIGLDEDALACGPDVPLGSQALIEHHRAHREPAAVLNCCSGKHVGFLTVARHLRLDHRGYIEPDHPVQRLVTAAVAEMTGQDLAGQRPGRDGCGIPTHAIAVASLAGAMARLVSPRALDRETERAARRLIEVPAGRQFWISGTGRHEVALGEAIDEPLLVKTGAEGVFLAGLPERGLGLALKVADGASRASEVAVSALLAHLGALSPDLVERPVLNKAGVEIGAITVADPEPSAVR